MTEQEKMENVLMKNCAFLILLATNGTDLLVCNLNFKNKFET